MDQVSIAKSSTSYPKQSKILMCQTRGLGLRHRSMGELSDDLRRSAAKVIGRIIYRRWTLGGLEEEYVVKH